MLSFNALTDEKKLELMVFDVGFDVGVSPHRVTIHHNNRDFGDKKTVLNKIEHDGTALWARDYETAGLISLKKYPQIATK